MNPNTPSSQSSRTIPLAQPQNAPNEQRDVQDRNVLGGRLLSLPEEELEMVNNQLGRVGWHTFCNEIAPKIHEQYVKQFYTYLTFVYENNDYQNPIITSYVDGKFITLNRPFLANLLNIPDVDKKTIRMTEKNLLEEYKSLCAIIDANILPNTATNNSVSLYKGFIIHSIATGRVLNLPFIILTNMIDMCHNNCKSLGYGGFLTTIFFKLGITILENESISLRSPLDQTTINKRKNHPFKTGAGPSQSTNENEDECEDEDEDEEQQA